ncbi:hypothetical protein VCHC52A1_0960, partial [Vibrio cholerae HC-52A1]
MVINPQNRKSVN